MYRPELRSCAKAVTADRGYGEAGIDAALEIYSLLCLGDARKTYDQNIRRFPV